MSRDDRLMRLSRDHHHALVLALRVQRELPGADEVAANALQADAVRFWTAALQPHIEAENEALLARIAKHGDGGLALAGRLQREHRELDEAMATVRNGGGGGGGSAERRAAVTRFGSLLGAHIRWEERELFEWLQATLSATDLLEASETFAMRLSATPVACPMPQTL